MDTGKKKITTNFYSDFLATRTTCISRILSEKEKVKIDNVTIEIEGPEYGWLDILFKVDGKKPILIEASDVFPPFPTLRSWLEGMMNFIAFPSGCCCIDCEAYQSTLSYDYLGSIKTDIIDEPVSLIMIGNDIAEENRSGDYEPLIQLVVPIRQFVSNFYWTLKNHMINNRLVYRHNWEHPNGGDFDLRKLLRSFTSKEIESTMKY